MVRQLAAVVASVFEPFYLQMSAWLGIRPLGQSAGDEYPKVFPHDIKHQVMFFRDETAVQSNDKLSSSFLEET